MTSPLLNKNLTAGDQRYKILFETSRDAIMTLAPPTWKFTSANPATVKMFNTKNEKEFISLGPWQVSPKMQPDGQPSDQKSKKMIMTAMKNGSHSFEWTHKTIDGVEFPTTVLLTALDLDGRKLLQATVRDISEQKIAQQKLEKKIEELEKFQKLIINRELKMVELKKQIKELQDKLNMQAKNENKE